MKRLPWAVLALTLSGAAFAAEQGYRAQGVLVPFGNPLEYQTYGYMEVWGVGSYNRYAAPATDTGDVYHDLIASSDAASAAALSGYAFASTHLSYDPAAAPYFVSASGNTARYNIGPMSVSLAGGVFPPISLAAADTAVTVSRNAAGSSQSVTFTRTTATVEGPVPGSTFAYAAPASTSFSVDLTGLLGPSAYTQSGFDLSAFATLPVRLATPTEFRPVGFSLFMARNQVGAGYGVTPPADLNVGDWNLGVTLAVYYDGIYGISVDAADYATPEAYAAASAWVGANIRQINFEQYVTYNVAEIVPAPVPEPAAAWLLLLGLAPVLTAARRR